MPINLRGSGILDSDGDILTRAGGEPVGISRASLATDAAFTARYRGLVAASGDATGATDVSNLNAAIIAAEAAGGGTVLCGAGDWYLNARVTIPDSVDLLGSGAGSPTLAGTRFVCTHASAGIGFAVDEETGSRGGLSGSFAVDGDDVATIPMYVGLAVCRTLIAIDSNNSAGDGWTIMGAQNCTFINCHSNHAAGVGMLLDASPQSNRFFNCGIDSPGTWLIKLASDVTPAAGLAGYPYYNHFYGGVWERGATDGGIWHGDGVGNAFHDIVMALEDHSATDPFVYVEAGVCELDGGIYQSNVLTTGTGLKVASGARLIISREVTVNNPLLAVDNSGTVDILGKLYPLAYTTYLSGNTINERAPMPVVPPAVGDYFGPATDTFGTNALNALNTMYCVPFVVPETMTISHFGIGVVAVGGTTAAFRVGLYGNTAGRPGSLICEGSATINAAAGQATGLRTVSITTPPVLTPGIYWGAVVAQGADALTPTLRTCASRTVFIPHTDPTQNGAPQCSWTRGSVTGALPTPAAATGVGSVNGQAPLLWVRRSS